MVNVPCGIHNKDVDVVVYYMLALKQVLYLARPFCEHLRAKKVGSTSW